MFGGMSSAGFRGTTDQTVDMFNKCIYAQFITTPRITYDRVLGAGIDSFLFNYASIMHLFLFYQGRQSSRAIG